VECSEEVVKDVPGQFQHRPPINRTPVGEFIALNHHLEGNLIMTSHRNSLCIAPMALLLVTHLIGNAPAQSGNWPMWRGPNGDGISLDKGLLNEWPKEGPKATWQIDTVGVGYSSISVSEGRIFTMGDLNGVEHVIALKESDGSVLWAVAPSSARLQAASQAR
jgi:hypothetical protein